MTTVPEDSLPCGSFNGFGHVLGRLDASVFDRCMLPGFSQIRVVDAGLNLRGEDHLCVPCLCLLKDSDASKSDIGELRVRAGELGYV